MEMDLTHLVRTAQCEGWGTGRTMEMDPTRLVGTAQYGGWGTGRMKLAQWAQRQRLRRNSAWAVGHRSQEDLRLNFCLEQDLDPGWGVMT
jgi:hypothetical protein